MAGFSGDAEPAEPFFLFNAYKWNPYPSVCNFKPTDKQLVGYYLFRKIHNLPLPFDVIQNLPIYDYCPEHLKEHFKPSYENPDLYFFTSTNRNYSKGSSRAAGNGYWKSTGTSQPIIGDNGIKIGSKKTLVFYRGKPPKGLNTNWLMHEYTTQETEDENNMKMIPALCWIGKSEKVGYESTTTQI